MAWSDAARAAALASRRAHAKGGVRKRGTKLQRHQLAMALWGRRQASRTAHQIIMSKEPKTLATGDAFVTASRKARGFSTRIHNLKKAMHYKYTKATHGSGRFKKK